MKQRTCIKCLIEMSVIVDVGLGGNCESGCCESRLVILQCPRCKTVKEEL